MNPISVLIRKIESPPGRRAQEFLVNLEFVVIGSLVAWFGWYALYDSWLPRDGFPWFLLVGILFILPLAFIYRRTWKIVCSLAIALSMILFAYAPHARKTFISTVYRLQKGMSKEQALSTIGSYPTEFHDADGNRLALAF